MPANAIQDGDTISRPESIVAADAVDESILIDIDSGNFFQLNKTAARIWGLVEQPRSFADLCAEVQRKYDISAEACRADVAEFVGQLQDQGVLVVSRT